MRKMLEAIAVATSATLPAVAAFDPDCVLYYDFETMADEYQVENVANPGVMQLSGSSPSPRITPKSATMCLTTWCPRNWAT